MDRQAAIRTLVERMGGTFTSLDDCLGEYDGLVIFEAPDSETALSVVLAARKSSFGDRLTRLYRTIRRAS